MTTNPFARSMALTLPNVNGARPRRASSTFARKTSSFMSSRAKSRDLGSQPRPLDSLRSLGMTGGTSKPRPLFGPRDDGGHGVAMLGEGVVHHLQRWNRVVVQAERLLVE